jgi:hypothetical protein
MAQKRQNAFLDHGNSDDRREAIGIVTAMAGSRGGARMDSLGGNEVPLPAELPVDVLPGGIQAVSPRPDALVDYVIPSMS